MNAPEIAENGAVVPITVETTLENVQSVSIVVDKEPSRTWLAGSRWDRHPRSRQWSRPTPACSARRKR
jgi:hypothetical protein